MFARNGRAVSVCWTGAEVPRRPEQFGDMSPSHYGLPIGLNKAPAKSKAENEMRSPRRGRIRVIAALAVAAVCFMAHTFARTFVPASQAQTTTPLFISFAGRVNGYSPPGLTGTTVTVNCQGLLGGANSTITYGLNNGLPAVPTYWALTGPTVSSFSGTSCSFVAKASGTANLDQGTLRVFIGGVDRTNSNSITPATASTLATATATTGFVPIFTSTDVVLSFTYTDGPNAGRYLPLGPSRILDSRFGIGTTLHKIAAGETVTLQLQGGLPLVPAQTRSVVLNFTVTEAESAGFITVYPCDAPLPNASNVNFVGGQTVANLVSVGLSAQGTVCAYASAPTELLADLFGAYLSGGQGFTPVAPVRILDTRTGNGTVNGKLTNGGMVELQVIGRGAVPAGALTAVLNITVTEPDAAGWVAVYRCDVARPFVSNLNFVQGLTVANLVYAQLDANGRTCIYASAGTHVVADVSGYLSQSAGTALTTVVPTRILDTRSGLGAARLGAGQTIALAVRGSGGVPTTATSAVMNVTATNTSAAGFLTIFACDEFRPTASNLNFVGGATVPNLTKTRISSSGHICIYASTATDVVADVTGYL